MAATTSDRQTQMLGQPVEETFTITTGQTLYIGAMVNVVISTGRVTNATAAASRLFAGVVVGLPDGSALGNTSGTTRARVSFGGVALLNVLTAARTFTTIGRNVFVGDNQSVTDTTGAGTSALRVKVGTLVKFEASDKSTGWIWLRNFAPTDAS